MENFIITLVCIALLVAGALTLATSVLQSINVASDALREEDTLARDRLDTSIKCKSSSTAANGTSVTIDIDNDGETALADFDAWDVIVRYQGGDTQWIPYSTATPGWTISGFFFHGRI